ncbi:hypothetical protein HYH02_014364 [Chlamydomonas schloesseri]|uniref:Methyltransferase domain-containing protein n=1 Tax=Chlamydomonas schloesseri TaxID=2026947 RepID=A0A835VUN3_9CHLO|nr:hypothetical protein HYH02_014364 [Chlamydomonas schloesseri]|eukprot:KAG2428560.1 hypothetical protein HYH02_014364 [Chlamydomonas schloesseri]
MVAAHSALAAIAGRVHQHAHPPRHPSTTHVQSHHQPASSPQVSVADSPCHEQPSAAQSAALSLSPAASLYAPDGSAVFPHGASAYSPAAAVAAAAAPLPLEGELEAFSATASPYRISGSGSGIGSAGTGGAHGVGGGGGAGSGAAAAAGSSGGVDRGQRDGAATAAPAIAHAAGSPMPRAHPAAELIGGVGAVSFTAAAAGHVERTSAASPSLSGSATASPAPASHVRLPEHLSHAMYPQAQLPSSGAGATSTSPAAAVTSDDDGAARVEAPSSSSGSTGSGPVPHQHNLHHPQHPQHQQQHHQYPQHHHGLHPTKHDPMPPVRPRPHNLGTQNQEVHHPHPRPHPHQSRQQQPHQQLISNGQQPSLQPPSTSAPAVATGEPQTQPQTSSPSFANGGIRPAVASGAALAVQGILPSPASPAWEEEVMVLLLGGQGSSSSSGGGRVSALDIFRRSYRVVRGTGSAATTAATAIPTTGAVLTASPSTTGKSTDAAAPALAAAAPSSTTTTTTAAATTATSFPSSSQLLPAQQQLPGRASSSGVSRISQPGSPVHSSSQLLLHQQLHSIDAIHKLIAAVAGTGLAPWEIHRPQKFVRDLVLRGCFTGRVLDAGCGIGDNALFIAKACPQAHVTAVDVVPRCLDFAHTKAGLRGLPASRLELAVVDLRNPDSLPEATTTNGTHSTNMAGASTGEAAAPGSGTGTGRPDGGAATAAGAVGPPLYDVVLDSYTFHSFSDEDRQLYLASLRRLLRPGGVLYMSCMSEEETRPGGPRRVSEAELRSVAHPGSGWKLEGVEETYVELHPTFWGGRAPAHLFMLRRL